MLICIFMIISFSYATLWDTLTVHLSIVNLIFMVFVGRGIGMALFRSWSQIISWLSLITFCPKYPKKKRLQRKSQRNNGDKMEISLWEFTLILFPALSWPLIGQAVSAYFPMNCPLSWAHTWWVHLLWDSQDMNLFNTCSFKFLTFAGLLLVWQFQHFPQHFAYTADLTGAFSMSLARTD